jgi:DNA-binding IscR family transcriptional regulator
MADSQKFAVAAHALAYLAHRDAMRPDAAVSSVELAASISTHPVIRAADDAAAERLSRVTVADLLVVG